MTERTSRGVVNQAIEDFNSIREAIRGHKIEVPYPTKTSAYADLIASIRVGSIAGLIYHDLIWIPNRVFGGTAEIDLSGFCISAIAGHMEANE